MHAVHGRIWQPPDEMVTRGNSPTNAEAKMSVWGPYQPTSTSPWDWRRVVHLHRRAGFGASWSDIQRDVSDGPLRAVNRVIGGNTSNSPSDFEEMSEVISDAAVSSGDPNRLKAWWMYRMMFSPHPLREKLTLLWHNHFATSNLKLKNLRQMLRQNQLFRQHALGPFRDLIFAVVKDPAILVWLDANSNRKGRPNENLARELMELFTLGIGNYTEDDIKHAAKALTGWTVTRDEFQWKPDRHEQGEKTILGSTKAFKGDDLVAMLLSNEATSKRLAWRLCQLLLGEGVADDRAIIQLAAGLRQHDLNTSWAVEKILRSQLFFSEQNINSRVSSPAEFVLGPIRSLELLAEPPSSVILAEWCTRLGQDLFYPPNVGGWKGGRSWLTSRTIIARSNFALALTQGQLRAPTKPPQIDRLLQEHRTANDLASAADFFAQLLLGREIENITRTKLIDEVSSQPETERLTQLTARILSQPMAFLT